MFLKTAELKKMMKSALKSAGLYVGKHRGKLSGIWKYVGIEHGYGIRFQ